MSEEPCPMCKDLPKCEVRAKETARQRASRTAHKLATDQAEVGYAGLEWLEIYTLFFARIYKHEYERNLTFERAIENEKNTIRHQDDDNVCGYHWENVMWLHDGFHKDTMKEVRREYATSKYGARKTR